MVGRKNALYWRKGNFDIKKVARAIPIYVCQFLDYQKVFARGFLTLLQNSGGEMMIKVKTFIGGRDGNSAFQKMKEVWGFVIYILLIF